MANTLPFVRFRDCNGKCQAVETKWKGGGPLATSATYSTAHELPSCVHVLVHIHAYAGSLNVLQRIYSNMIKRKLKI